MNNDLISREALKERIKAFKYYEIFSKSYLIDIIDNAPTVKPCENCDLYFKAMTKEEMMKGGEENG